MTSQSNAKARRLLLWNYVDSLRAYASNKNQTLLDHSVRDQFGQMQLLRAACHASAITQSVTTSQNNSILAPQFYWVRCFNWILHFTVKILFLQINISFRFASPTARCTVPTKMPFMFIYQTFIKRFSFGFFFVTSAFGLCAPDIVHLVVWPFQCAKRMSLIYYKCNEFNLIYYIIV